MLSMRRSHREDPRGAYARHPFGHPFTDRVLAAANRLFCIGCFCIGTNQVRVDTARKAGVPVFNAPYSNTRSVAELVIGEIVMLLRGVPESRAWPMPAVAEDRQEFL